MHARDERTRRYANAKRPISLLYKGGFNLGSRFTIVSKQLVNHVKKLRNLRDLGDNTLDMPIHPAGMQLVAYTKQKSLYPITEIRALVLAKQPITLNYAFFKALSSLFFRDSI